MDRRAFAVGRAGALATIVLAAALCAQAAGEKIALARHLKPGATATYKGNIKANIGGTEIEFAVSQKQTIKVVKETGAFVALTEDLGGTLKQDGKEEAQPPTRPYTETRDKLGKLIDFAQELDPNPAYTPEINRLMMGMRELILPDKEVAEGDVWDTLIENPVFPDNKAKLQTTFQGIDKISGADAWKFKQTAEAVVNTDGSKMTVESTIWVNPKDGFTEKLDGKIHDLPTTNGPVDVSMLIQRVKRADNAKAK